MIYILLNYIYIMIGSIFLDNNDVIVIDSPTEDEIDENSKQARVDSKNQDRIPVVLLYIIIVHIYIGIYNKYRILYK